MQKYLSIGTALLITSSLFAGNAIAQQSSSTTSKTSTSAKSQTKSTTSARTTHKATPQQAKPLVLTTQKDKQSYAIGLNIGKGLQHDSVDIDPKIFLQGLQDALADRKSLLTDDEIKATLTEVQNEVRQKREAQRLALIEKNKKDGQDFLAANSKKEGVVTLPSGLQYKILKEGTGPKPTANDTVVCNYRGTLLDNTEFDSSYKRGQPITLNVSQVIKGWTEALQLMPVGSKWQLFIPADLAYGDRGQGPIAPDSTLIFEVELLSIQAKSEQQPAQPAQPSQPAKPSQTPQPNQK